MERTQNGGGGKERSKEAARQRVAVEELFSWCLNLYSKQGKRNKTNVTEAPRKNKKPERTFHNIAMDS